MYYPKTPAEVWVWLLVLSSVMGLTFYAFGLAIFKLWRMKRRLVVVLPEVVGAWARIELVKAKRGIWSVRTGDEGEARILHGESAYPTNRGPLHVLSEYGANLVAPTKDEAQEVGADKPLKMDPKKFIRFRVWDPLALWRACRENDMEDLYSAQKDKDHWMVKVFPMLAVLLILVLAAAAFIIWRTIPVLQSAAGG